MLHLTYNPVYNPLGAPIYCIYILGTCDLGRLHLLHISPVWSGIRPILAGMQEPLSSGIFITSSALAVPEELPVLLPVCSPYLSPGHEPPEQEQDVTVTDTVVALAGLHCYVGVSETSRLRRSAPVLLLCGKLLPGLTIIRSRTSRYRAVLFIVLPGVHNI